MNPACIGNENKAFEFHTEGLQGCAVAVNMSRARVCLGAVVPAAGFILALMSAVFFFLVNATEEKTQHKGGGKS